MPPSTEGLRYRNIEDGNAGYREGDDIVLDRPNERVIRPYNDRVWMLDKDFRPLNRSQMAKVAFEADAALCKALNQPRLNDGEWLNLPDKKRIAWLERGPQKGVRGALYAHIMQALAPLGEPG